MLKDDGTTQIVGFDLPLSSLLDTPTRAALLEAVKRSENHAKKRPQGAWNDPNAIQAHRAFIEEHVLSAPIKRMKELHDVRIQPETLGGVYTEIFAPASGIPARNAERILINLHGGAFTMGARAAGQVESIAVAGLGKIKVVSVDYRMGPEHQFPAASEDVAAVYRHLLKAHAPENIGIYGFSAGGVLTAQSVAWFLKERLPLPGAIGLFGAAASYWGEGDSGHFAAAMLGFPVSSVVDLRENPYLKNADPDDPLVTPVRHPNVMAKFPPSLLISATRDVSLSSVVHTHSRLVQLGVETELYVWEGVGHGFLYEDPDLPQSREGHELIVKFFERHLGKKRAPAG